jgi:hypothetical protein
MKKTVLMLVLSWMVSMAVAQPATMSKEGDSLIKFVSIITSPNLEKHPQAVERPFLEFITPSRIETKGESIMFSFNSDTIVISQENHAIKLIKGGWLYKPGDPEQINRLLKPLWWYQEFVGREN